MKFKIYKGNHEKLGVGRQGDIITFSVSNLGHKACSLILYPKDGNKPERIPMMAGPLKNAIYSVGLHGFHPEGYDYNFEIDGKVIIDPYARKISGREQWADKDRKGEDIKSSFYFEDFAWKKDVLPGIPKEDMIMYKLHVRGFSSGIPATDMPKGSTEKGRIGALVRKIRYLKELGITTLELMPAYEFEEILALDKSQKERFPAGKINYWGYTQGNYFAPKAAYLGEGASPSELKQFIQKLHHNQMECILEFYFDKKLNPNFIIDILRYWANEYHVDGFHLLCSEKAAWLAAQDIHLSGRKLFFEKFPEEMLGKVYQTNVTENYNIDHSCMELFIYDDRFSYGIRKMINRQDGNLGEFLGQMRRQHDGQGFVNFIANNNGFTLYDLFSYSQKYNQGNGEENQDGIEWNYSSNCGEEGPTRKKSINGFRLRQIKNALSTLYFSQGTPLLFMGDENGNTQQGNNNAWCQDNMIGWKSWQKDKKGKDIVNFIKKLTDLRKDYPILKNPAPMRLEDYNRVGFPDLSYHGERGWQLDDSRSQPLVGMMYCGKYAKKTAKEEYIYIGYNFSQTPQRLALPDLPGKLEWIVIMDTGADVIFKERATGKKNGHMFAIKRQSVCLLVGKEGKAGHE